MLKWLEGKLITALREPAVIRYLKKASQLEEKIRETHEKIAAEAPADIADHETEHLSMCDIIMDILVDLEVKKKAFHTTTQPPPPPPPKAKVKLPELKLPIFTGEVTEWISYRDIFVSTIHDDTALSAIQKLTYLKSTLSGEAAHLVKALPISDENYTIAWDTIKRRYENKRELYFASVTKFCRLNTSSLEPAQALRTIIDSANECSRTIDTLTIPDKWDSMLLYLVSQKLDQDSRQSWEQTLKDTEIPKSSEMLDFLEQRARAIASTSTSRPKQPQENRKQQTFHARLGKERRGTGFQCKICSESHSHFFCPKLGAMLVQERQNEVQVKKLCLNCLRDNHDVSQCKSEYSCQVCHKKHSTLLHEEREASNSAPRETILKNYHINQKTTQTILATAQVQAKDWTGEPVILKALLDAGSTASFMSEHCANKLGLKKKKATEEVIGLSSLVIGRTRGMTTLTFKPHFESREEFQVKTFVLKEVTSQLPLNKLETSKWTHLKNLQMADPTFNIPTDIDLLLGADLFYDLLENGKKTGPRGTPAAQNSKLGWLVVGSIGSSSPRIQVHNAEVRLQESLQKFSEIESAPKTNLHTEPAPASETRNAEVPVSSKEEVEKQSKVKFTAGAQINDFNSVMLSRYSSLKKLKRVTAWCFRFYHKLKELVPIKKKSITCKSVREDFLTIPELESALNVWIRAMQTSKFQSEIAALTHNKPLSPKSKILALSPFLDKNGIIRVGGRLCHSNLQPERKNPVLFPRHHRLTQLLIQNTHLYLGPFLLCAIPGRRVHLQIVSGLRRFTGRKGCPSKMYSESGIESSLNSGPLTCISTDPQDLTALTPAHFLIGHPLRAMPDPDLTEVPENRLSRWRMVQRLQQHFWRRWSSEYLTRLQRPRLLAVKSQIRIGDLVLVKGEDLAPTRWPLARVIEVHPGSHGLTRVVTLRTTNGVMKRPIVKLCLLPIETPDVPTNSSDEDNVDVI